MSSKSFMPLLKRQLDVGAADDVVRSAHQIPRRGIDAHLIAGQLLENKLRIGQVIVERANDPIAIGPGIGPRGVGFVAVALAKANHVEPMPGPTLAIARRGQQTIDQPLVGVAGTYRSRRLRSPAAKAASRASQSRAANERGAIGFSGWLQALLFEPGQHERIDGRAHTIGVATRSGRPAFGAFATTTNRDRHAFRW